MVQRLDPGGQLGDLAVEDEADLGALPDPCLGAERLQHAVQGRGRKDPADGETDLPEVQLERSGDEPGEEQRVERTQRLAGGLGQRQQGVPGTDPYRR